MKVTLDESHVMGAEGMPPRVEKNKVVYITYEIWGEKGHLFERSDIPVGYVHRVQGPLIERVEQSLEGHEVGDIVQIPVPPAEGFGEYRPELTFTDDLENVPEDYRYVGSQAEFQNEQGETLTVVVSGMEGGKLTVDANHPLAGQTVMFRVTMVAIREATSREIAGGVPQQTIDASYLH
jgi:FKBP-type peptidyl-prolyl cis-trans isomerase SlyD